MIIVFPLLTDESISPNVLPGICKTVEKFIITYELDAVMKITGTKILSFGGKMVASTIASKILMKTKKESLDVVTEGRMDDYPEYQNPLTDKTIKSLQMQVNDYIKNINTLDADAKKRFEFVAGRLDKELERYADEWKRNVDHWKIKTDSAEKDARLAMDMEKYNRDKNFNTLKNVFDTVKSMKDLGKVEYTMPLNNTLSLEPTYITATTTEGTKLIGIKVIPIPIKAPEGYSLAEVLTKESSMNLLQTILTSIKRKMIRMFWAAYRGLVPDIISDRVVTGDPTKDILWASSYHRRYVYCLLNFADVTSDFFRNAGGVHKLHKVGWNSFIIADDVNKRAIFCMKEFHGLCSSISYQFIYSSFGRDQSEVYEKLEDVKKSVSPFFKTKMPENKVFGVSEQITLESYLNKLV